MIEGIEIQQYRTELAKDAKRLYYMERYTVSHVIKKGSAAPFVHIVAATFAIYLWNYAFPNFTDFISDVLISYAVACMALVGINFILLNWNITHFGEIWENHLMQNGSNIWVAMDVRVKPHKLVGMVGVKSLSATHAELRRYMVSTNYRGMGIGGELLSTAIQFTQDEDFNVLVVDLWDISTSHYVNSLYERRGFIIYKRTFAPFIWLPMYIATELHKTI